jgi:hypothetical protein
MNLLGVWLEVKNPVKIIYVYEMSGSSRLSLVGHVAPYPPNNVIIVLESHHCTLELIRNSYGDCSFRVAYVSELWGIRSAAFLESRHVLAFTAISFFNCAVYFLILGVCRQLALDQHDLEAQTSLKPVEGPPPPL